MHARSDIYMDVCYRMNCMLVPGDPFHTTERCMLGMLEAGRQYEAACLNTLKSMHVVPTRACLSTWWAGRPSSECHSEWHVSSTCMLPFRTPACLNARKCTHICMHPKWLKILCSGAIASSAIAPLGKTQIPPKSSAKRMQASTILLDCNSSNIEIHRLPCKVGGSVKLTQEETQQYFKPRAGPTPAQQQDGLPSSSSTPHLTCQQLASCFSHYIPSVL